MAVPRRDVKQAALDFARRFARDERGMSAVVFGIMFAVLLLVAALAIDHGRIVTEAQREQRSLDAAILAASDELGLPDQEVTGPERAEAYFRANMPPGSQARIKSLSLDAQNGTVSAVAGSGLAMTLMKAFGYQSVEIAVAGTAAKGGNSMELALVLDNSGSMSGDMEALKGAATNLLGQVFAGAEGTDKVRVAVVPFAASVNVGAHNRGAGWLDDGTKAAIHTQNFSETASRWDLFDAMGVAWAGCVEARVAPHDVLDTQPTSSNPNTFFTPMFAPDEPGDADAALQGYANSYLDDDGGACPRYSRTCTGGYTRRGSCRSWTVDRLPNPEAQARTCKYAGAAPGGDIGPNQSCTTRPILPLTSARAQVEEAIQGMIASGNTNIAEGAMWGWRVLSSAPPFTEGQLESRTSNTKYLVLMTDGENTYGTNGGHNGTTYSAFGYGAPYRAPAGRLGTTLTSAALVEQMNSKTVQACANAKAAGITVFTIAFRAAAASPTASAILGQCASDASKAFLASDAAALQQAFERIGRELSKLRLAS
jgi:Mg-chelatase subunit ChlD